MQKFLLLLSLLGFLSGCSSTEKYNSVDINNLSGLEKLVLCEETLDSKQAIRDVGNPNLYGTKNRRFYYPLKPVKSFGMEVQFVGYGVMDVYGPNITVTGSNNELRSQVELVIGKPTECKSNYCGWKLSEKRSVWVYPHQKDSTMAVVQCAYELI